MEKLKLSLVYDALEMVSQECNMFIDLTKNEIVEVFDFMDEEEKEEIYFEIEENEENYLRLPNQYELNEYDRMVRFIYSLNNEEYVNKLLNAIHGKGAYRRFKDTIIYLGVRDLWFDFKKKDLIKVAKEILEENEIPYINDLNE